MAQTSPTVAGWQLMLRIRQRAKVLGLKASTIQKTLGISSAYWSQVANYRGVLTEEKLTSLLGLLEIEDDEKQDLLRLREIAKSRGWWNEYSALFHDELMRLYGLEHGAQSIRSIDNIVIPGLLQTEDYIRALLSSVAYTARPTEADQRVQVRLQRQQRLAGPEALRLCAVIGQAALMQEVGGPAVHLDQLRYLIELAEKHADTLEIRVIPFNARGSVASLNAATFQLLAFDSPQLPDLGWLETAIYGEVIDDPKKVAALEYLYNQVASIALDRDGSRELIESIARQKESQP